MERLTITEHIDINFREYAFYTLEHRGIPDWHDSLTNVQRMILFCAPKTFQKTNSLIGSVTESGYSHGDASLANAIARLAKPHSVAESLLEGDGNFGTPFKDHPAAPRYTSVKLSKNTLEIISEMSFLNKGEVSETDYLKVGMPLGLFTGVMGIAVGYKSVILPRSSSSIKDYLSGKIKTVKPSYKGFQGKISKVKGMDSSWLIESNLEIDESRRTIRVKGLPPVIKYERFIDRVRDLSEYFDFDFINESQEDIDVLLKFAKSDTSENWIAYKSQIEKFTRIVVKESIVFIKDKTVVEYETIEDYLDEFKDYLEVLKLEVLIYRRDKSSYELEFLKAKLAYLKYMLDAKRNRQQVLEFLKKYPNSISDRLDVIRLSSLNAETIKETEIAIKEEMQKLKTFNQDVKNQEKILKSLKFTIKAKIKVSNSLFDEFRQPKEHNGVNVWEGPEEEIEENEEEIEG
jgi:DNA gyrase/topoisomerase IV subunit A